MSEPIEGYTVGLPKPKRRVLAEAGDWLKSNPDVIAKIALFAMFAFLIVNLFVGAIRADAEDQEARADCYGSGGQYAEVGLGDDLCYRDGKVWKVYQT